MAVDDKIELGISMHVEFFITWFSNAGDAGDSKEMQEIVDALAAWASKWRMEYDTRNARFFMLVRITPKAVIS